MYFQTVKAGGMRIVQHKTPNTERPAKDLEDCTGLTVSQNQSYNLLSIWKIKDKIILQSPPNITPSATTVSGVQVKGVHDYPTEAVQAAHAPKIPQSVPQKPMHNINQPRKQIVRIMLQWFTDFAFSKILL